MPTPTNPRKKQPPKQARNAAAPTRRHPATVASGGRGRPTIRTEETAAEICQRISIGQSLYTVCKDAHMPDYSSVMDWLNAEPDFADRYARARRLQADHLAEEILRIADDASQDYGTDENGNRIVDHEHIARAKLRVDSRKWLAAKMHPEHWADKPAAATVVSVNVITPEAAEQRVRRTLPYIERAAGAEEGSTLRRLEAS